MSDNGTIWLPPASSTVAGEVDGLFYFIYWISVISFILLVGTTFYFAWAYRRRPGGPKVVQFTHGLLLEISWSVIPAIILLFVFAWGFKGYMRMAIAPANAMEVRVVGQKWSWSFNHCGKQTAGELRVPVGKPVKLIMSSQDVLHSFYVPEFRTKADVIPGRYTTLWFEATSTGEKQVFCTEYCGDQHSGMLAKAIVMEQDEFQKWCDAAPEIPSDPVAYGAQAYKARGCNACHSLDGAAGVGPTFKGVWGRQEQLADGSAVVVDENYVRRSILEPTAQVVAGFQPVMPTYTGMMQDPEIDAIIAYLKTVQ